jgi:hypothetical protein
MGKRNDDDDDRAPDLSGAPGTRRTRTETIDFAAVMRSNREAFEAGASQSRQLVDTLNQALKDAHEENKRLREACGGAIEKSQELVGKLQAVASQNVALTLAEGQGKAQVQETIQKGENIRHAMSLAATSPFLPVLAQKLFPDLALFGPKPAGPGNTPREAAQRFAASLMSGSENAKTLHEVLTTYCEEEIGRPGDVALLLEFFQGAIGGEAPAGDTKTQEGAAG